MKYLQIGLSSLLLSITILSCEDKEPSSAQCGRDIFINDQGFHNAKDDSEMEITDATITGNCMIIKYTYSGGCGGLSTQLVAEQLQIKNTKYPAIRELKLSFDDQDKCEALISTSEEFDITSLQGAENPIIITLHKWNKDIEYSY
jgi:hypothetical protein